MDPFATEHRVTAVNLSTAQVAETPEILNGSNSVEGQEFRIGDGQEFRVNNGQEGRVNNGQEFRVNDGQECRVNEGQECRIDNGQEFRNDNGQKLGKRPIAMAMPNEHDQLMAYPSQELAEQMFDQFFGKRRRLGTHDPYSTPQKKLMDLEDDSLYVIFLALIGGEKPKNVRPRQLKSLQSAYSFVLTNSRILQFFRTCICDKIHTVDTIYPLEKGDEHKLFPRCQARPESISFLSYMLGRSLRVLRLASFQDICNGNRTHRDDQWRRANSLMRTIACNCQQLTELTFQDAGSADLDVAKLLFFKNPGLKKLQVDIPCPPLMHALAASNCNLEVLSLFKVQPASLPGLRNVLKDRGGSLRKLAIEMCFPLDKDFDPTPANKARCRRREKSFTEALEVLTRIRMKSLRALHLYPDRRAGWFKIFIRHFQLLGQADLIIGSDWLKVIYPAAKTLDPPKGMFKRIAMDLLVSCHSQHLFENLVETLHEPDTLSIMRSGFAFAYVSERYEHLEGCSKAIICRKGKNVSKLHLACPCQRLQVFEVFLDTVTDILNFFEEKFESLDQLQELWIPIHMVKYLGRGIGYEKFIARLSNLKVLHLVKTTLDTQVSIMVPIGLPTFLRGLMNACPELESIYISNKDYTTIMPEVRKDVLNRAIEDALLALDEYEEAKPKLDTWTLRRQLVMWYRKSS